MKGLKIFNHLVSKPRSPINHSHLHSRFSLPFFLGLKVDTLFGSAKRNSNSFIHPFPSGWIQSLCLIKKLKDKRRPKNDLVWEEVVSGIRLVGGLTLE